MREFTKRLCCVVLCCDLYADEWSTIALRMLIIVCTMNGDFIRQLSVCVCLGALIDGQ